MTFVVKANYFTRPPEGHENNQNVVSVNQSVYRIFISRLVKMEPSMLPHNILFHLTWSGIMYNTNVKKLINIAFPFC